MVIFGAGLRSCAAAFLSSDKLRRRVAPTGTSTYSNVAIVLGFWSRKARIQSSEDRSNCHERRCSVLEFGSIRYSMHEVAFWLPFAVEPGGETGSTSLGPPRLALATSDQFWCT